MLNRYQKNGNSNEMILPDVFTSPSSRYISGRYNILPKRNKSARFSRFWIIVFFLNSGGNIYRGNYMWCFARFATRFSSMKHVQTEFKENFTCIVSPFHASVWCLYHLKTSTKKTGFLTFSGAAEIEHWQSFNSTISVKIVKKLLINLTLFTGIC